MRFGKAVTAAVVLASMSALGACSSAAKVTATTSQPPVTSATSPTSAAGSSSAGAPATSASASAPMSAKPSPSAAGSSAGAKPTTGGGTPVLTVPDGALLALSDLASWRTGAWTAIRGDVTAAADMVDPDSCDPVVQPQEVDPNYPRNPAWANMRTAMWSGPNGSYVSESVVTYKSASAARADYLKHHGWVADCGSHFQWTDRPAKYAGSPRPLTNIADAYAIRVAMSGPDEPASAAGSQGYAYMAVILRGNSLTVVEIDESGTDSTKATDPGATGAIQHDVAAAATKLGGVFK